MPANVPPQELDVTVRFGAGLHTRAGEDSIGETECTDGQNFRLDLENQEFRRREPFDLVGQAPNGSQINGFAQLIKTDGTKSTLVQAGTKIYEWDGTLNGFTDTGASVSSSARLRGSPFTAHWPLSTEVVLISDIAFVEPVKQWDGTTFADVSHNLAGDFKAKYAYVANERAFFAHVSSNSTDTPHMIVGSQRSDYTTLSVSSRPASGANAEDPFFLLAPDLKPINGLVEAFGLVTFSTEGGSVFKLTGQDKTDFAIGELHPRSGASGDESMVFVGDDVWYGRRGRIESLRATDQFGDVESVDPSVPIQDQITTRSDWTLLYNAQLQRIYAMHGDQGELWVYYKPLRGRSNLESPWIKYTTNHSSGFNWTAQMSMISPVSSVNTESIYFGDSSGNIYQLEGSGTGGDGGSDNITSSRTSKLFVLPLDAGMYQVDGWLKYHKNEAATVNITLLHAGEQVFDAQASLGITAPTNVAHWSGDYYFGGETFFGVFGEDRVVREAFAVPAGSNEFQVKVEVEGTTSFRINEIGLRFHASS